MFLDLKNEGNKEPMLLLQMAWRGGEALSWQQAGGG